MKSLANKVFWAEFIGTFILVFFGCGTAMVCGGLNGGTGAGFLGVVAIALAFGLAIVAAAYAIGDVSGCHVNPAVSLAMWITGRISGGEFFLYILAQFMGGTTASAALMLICKCSDLSMDVNGLGANGFGEYSALHLDMWGALAVEVILTFIFVLTIMGVIDSGRTANMAGIVIGLTLTGVHLVGIPLTGTSVNPARSLAPALMLGGDALHQVWVFIVAPFVGAALAAFFYNNMIKDEEDEDWR